MRTLVTFRIATHSLQRTLLRSFLTTLGVIIGVASVITMVGLGSGAKAVIEATFSNEQWRMLNVTATMPMTEWRDGVYPRITRGAGLTLQDYDALLGEVHGITMSGPSVSSNGQAEAKGRRVKASLYGGNASTFILAGRKLLRGVVFGEVDIRRASSVCLLSESAERLLFEDVSSLGRIVTINGLPFVVLGVMEDYRRTSAMTPDGEIVVFLPMTSLLRRIDPDAAFGILLQTAHREQVEGLKSAVRELLESRRGKRRVRFDFSHAADGQRRMEEGSRTMSLLLAAIAGVSLLVGGIGIMNTMLVNVAERTREIGIRLAIGTRENDIMRQFLVEATILSLFGGLIGVILGVGAAKLLTYINGWPTVITTAAILGAFLCSASVGIFFGYYPAMQAARLDPIVALRSE